MKTFIPKLKKQTLRIEMGASLGHDIPHRSMYSINITPSGDTKQMRPSEDLDTNISGTVKYTFIAGSVIWS
jgi:hypothetical protein